MDLKNVKTKNGHNMYDALSMMRRAISQKIIDLACYCAYELYGNFRDRLWDALTSMADCNEVEAELRAMRIADDIINKSSKGYDRDPLFVAKAVVLLCIDKDKDRNGVNSIDEDEKMVKMTMEKMKNAINLF